MVEWQNRNLCGDYMKVMVCGSRSIRDDYFIFDVLDKLNEEYEITEVIHGGAGGVDTYAGIWAKHNHIKETVYFPQYSEYGRRAPLVRNTEMVNDCDNGIAIWDGISRGTKDSIEKLKKQDKLIKVVKYDKNSA